MMYSRPTLGSSRLTVLLFIYFLSFAPEVASAPNSLAASACLPAPIRLSVGNCSIVTASQATAIRSWGVTLSIGNVSTLSSSGDDDDQPLCLTPSLVTNSTMLTAPNILCNDAALVAQNLTRGECYSRRGGGVKVDTSGNPVGLQTGSIAGLVAANPGWPTIMDPLPPFSVAVNADLNLPDGRSVTMLNVPVITAGNNHTSSALGMGDNSTLLATAINTGLIGASRSWGYDVGSTSYSKPRAGGLTLGGKDMGAIAGGSGTHVYNMSAYDKVVNKGRVCPLQVQIVGMALVPSNVSSSTASASDDFPLISESQPLSACLEPYDVYARLSLQVLDRLKTKFARLTGHTGAPRRYSPIANPFTEQDPLLRQLLSVYVPEPGLIYPLNNATGSFDAKLVITLAGGQIISIPSHELFNPVRGLAADGSRAIADSWRELAVYQDSAPANAAVLGRSFLSQVYLFVDYDRREFTLSASAGAELTDGGGAAPAPPVALVATAPPSKEGLSTEDRCATGEEGTTSSPGLDTTLGKVVLGINIPVLVLLLAVIAYWAAKRWLKEKKKTQRPSGENEGRDAPEVGERPTMMQNAPAQQPMAVQIPTSGPALDVGRGREGSMAISPLSPIGNLSFPAKPELPETSAKDSPGATTELQAKENVLEADSGRPRFTSDASTAFSN
ncbi:hypothetical protein B0H63DRAFT_473784 [Podospora didyma]|uniref:Peptidase A1 domain-containing protein n=1 Tax=Podospora didyma TaxID=330526 RepID=A0AAE0NQK0_9PEZI|nr:hypothetical protein B0H63DRAFT_473784 [Podospora didyma]